MSKPADKDILKTLEYLELEAEMLYAIMGDSESDHASLRDVRRAETLIRRLAREAGYDLSADKTAA